MRSPCTLHFLILLVSILAANNSHSAGEVCQIGAPNQIASNQELRAEVSSRGLARVQVSADGGPFGDFTTINGVQSWVPNSFSPGSYNIRYRGVKADGQIVNCEPSSQTIRVTEPVSNPPVGKSYPSFVPVVSQAGSSTNFKSAQGPQTLGTMTVDGVRLKVLDYQAMSNLHGTLGQMKFFLPPGTVGFDANFYYYLAYQDGKGALKLHVPPMVNIETIPPTAAANKDVFQRLANGQEVHFYTAGAPANFLLISSTDNIAAPLPIGGYVYSNFRHPGGQFQRSLWKIYVKADCYDKWYNSSNTRWDSNGNPAEGFSHTCN